MSPEQPANLQKFMRSALGIARRGLALTSPNPSVGAVITRSGQDGETIIARAVTGPGGTPHAEPQALSIAGDESRGATLYVTLEPCNHHGRTPPCTEAIIRAGIAHVVVASHDLDPRVSGSGVEKLRRAGIRVTTGILEAEADRLNCGHRTLKTKARPYIIIKSAVGADDRIAPGGNNGGTNGRNNNTGETATRWVTSLLARRRGHLLRAEVDAILIGRETASVDNPSLTCRLPGMAARSPRPVVLDTRLSLSPDLKIFRKDLHAQPPLVVCASTAPQDNRTAYARRNAEILPITPDASGQIDLTELVHALGNLGITRLLVEGGPKIAASFISAGLYDQLNIFKGPRAAGKGSILPFADQPLQWATGQPGVNLDHSQALGDNIMYQYIKS